MDFHVMTPHGPKLVMQVVDGQLVVVPPPPAPAGDLAVAAPSK